MEFTLFKFRTTTMSKYFENVNTIIFTTVLLRGGMIWSFYSAFFRCFIEYTIWWSPIPLIWGYMWICMLCFPKPSLCHWCWMFNTYLYNLCFRVFKYTKVIQCDMSTFIYYINSLTNNIYVTRFPWKNPHSLHHLVHFRHPQTLACLFK